MNSINIAQVSVESTIPTPLQNKKIFKQTIESIFDSFINAYHIPDDAGLTLTIKGIITKNEIRVTVEGYPESTSIKPKFVVVLNYTSDVELTECLYDDLVSIFSHFCLTALYNRSNKEILCVKEVYPFNNYF